MNLKATIKQLFNSVKLQLVNASANPNKIKLVAIAKNESAYLSEWIYHHLYFGFNHIEIHVNATTDNTDELIQKLALLEQVKFITADETFNNLNIKFPQMHVYNEALSTGTRDKFTHIMFLDIDEFWLPNNFTSNIYDCIKRLKGDVISFEWFLKYDEPIPFSPVLPAKLLGKKSAQLKSIVKTGLHTTYASPHNMVVPQGSNMLADGSVFHPTKENFSVAPNIDENAPVKDYFVLHRMFRSQDEYVAMLGRTNPFKRPGFNSTFKDNRFGYDANDIGMEITLPIPQVQHYNNEYAQFRQSYDLDITIKKARTLMLARKKDVLQQIKDAPLNENRILRKILKRVTDQETNAAFGQFKSRHNLSP
jgi:hypothetical protein